MCKSARICSSRGFFAQRLWEESATIINDEYPGIMDIQFGEQADDGIYSISFKYDPDELSAAQTRIMRGLINNGFSIDEYLNQEYEETERRKIIRFNGVLDYSFDELYQIFHDTKFGKPLPISTRKNVRFTYEECEEYYKTFNERMLTLGNQRRAYKFFETRNRGLFEAAKTGNKKELRKMVNEGRSVNEIAPTGDTVFTLLLQYLIDHNENRDINDEDERFLDYLYEAGLKVNLVGVDEVVDPPLFTAWLYRSKRLFEWLLGHGADINAEVGYDYDATKDYSCTIQDWIDGHPEEEIDRSEVPVMNHSNGVNEMATKKEKPTIEDYKDRMTCPINVVLIDPVTRKPITKPKKKGK